jgi:predicted ATP-binding protein involved in virulence
MSTLQKEDIKVINKALSEFEKSLKSFERDSKDAFALVIFINGCYDTGNFASNKYSALVHFQQARKSASIIESLSSENINHFNQAIKSAHSILINSNIVHPDFILSS